jgi:hypothetical protein
MKHPMAFALVAVMLWPGTALCPLAWAQGYKNEDEEARAYNVTRTVKTVEGLNFVVEEDRPIEKVAGVYRPIDMDSYVALKFNKLQKTLEEKIAFLQERIDALEAEVARLKASRKPSS